MNEEDYVEFLASLIHDQWTVWSKTIANTENISQERKDRWRGYWCPYCELSETDKNSDREFARIFFHKMKKENAYLD